MAKPVIITWLDSHSPDQGPWLDPAIINHKPLKIKTVGYVLKESKKTITLASSKPKGGEQVSGVMCIPKCCILKRKAY